MAAKIVRRKEKRAEVEAAEKKAKAAPKKAAAAKKEPAKRKSRAKSAKDVRLKAFWGVFNQSLKRVALYEFSEKKEADKKAKELTASGKIAALRAAGEGSGAGIGSFGAVAAGDPLSRGYSLARRRRELPLVSGLLNSSLPKPRTAPAAIAASWCSG